MKGRDDPEPVVSAILIDRPTLADVIDRVLDKGIVIEYHVDRVSVGGIDLLVTVDARCVVASLESYLKYAEALRKTGLLWGTNTRPSRP